MSDNKNILLNRMYTGKYTETEENIGHEIINFFKCDDGKIYTYVTAKGDINTNKSIDYILLTSEVINNEFEILAKAKINKNEKNDGILYEGKKFREKLHIEQAKNIKYGEQYLYNILRNNFHNDNAIYATCECESIKKTEYRIIVKCENIAKFKEYNKEFEKNEIDQDMEKIKNSKDKNEIANIKNKYIHIDEDSNNKRLTISVAFEFGEDNKRYLPANTNVYNQFLDIIIKKEYLWKSKEEYEPSIVTFDENSCNDEKINFLNVIKKEYEETIYTNLLHYYFNMKLGKGDTILFNRFVKYLCDKKIIPNNSGSEINNIIKKLSKIKFSEVKREEPISYEDKNGIMDLVAIDEDSKSVIIIENKIKSKLNDKKENMSQLDKYYDYYKKYLKYENVVGLIFVPNYNYKQIETDESFNEDIRKIFAIIQYSDLLDFFNKEKKDICKEENVYKKYFNELIGNIELQKDTSDEKMLRKFKRAIQEVKSSEIEYYVFALPTNDGIYVGSTNNITRRELELVECTEGNLNYLIKLKIKKQGKDSDDSVDSVDGKTIELMFNIQEYMYDYIKIINRKINFNEINIDNYEKGFSKFNKNKIKTILEKKKKKEIKEETLNKEIKDYLKNLKENQKNERYPGNDDVIKILKNGEKFKLVNSTIKDYTENIQKELFKCIEGYKDKYDNVIKK